jgi:hypothetical protein
LRKRTKTRPKVESGTLREAAQLANINYTTGGYVMRSLTTSFAIALLVGASSLAMAAETSKSPSTTGTSSATSGTSTGGVMSEAQVKQHLQKEGYTDINGLKEEKDGTWMGKAKHNGKAVTVDVDKSGKVTTAK